MEFETLNQMNEGMYLSLMMIKITVLIMVLFVFAGFVIYLAGAAWLCFKETHRSITAPRSARYASRPNIGRSMKTFYSKTRLPASSRRMIRSTS